jgi:drug/metabolite transporter (DMT)-like permease
VNYHRLALCLVAGSSAANSVNGLLLRSVEAANEWQLVFYRSASLALSLAIVFLLIHRTNAWTELKRLSGVSIAGAVALSVTNTGFIWSVQHTTVANTMFVLGAIPFFTAILAWLFLGERVAGKLWGTIGLAMAGVLIMVGDGIGTGNAFGNAIAVLTAFGFATYVVILRRGRTTDMLPIVVLSGMLSAGVAAAMVQLDLSVPVRDAGLMIVWGAGLSALVHFLFTFGSRHVQGAELSLMALLEFALAPIWVLLVFDERPTALTLVGGTLVMAAVLAQAGPAFRKDRDVPDTK